MSSQNISTAFQEYTSTYHLEKIYISHDKPVYVPGETIWCSLHLVNGRTHEAFEGQSVVYVDWIDPTGLIKAHYTLQVENGVASFDISTFTTDTSGTYQLRAYTQYQRNFPEAYLFQKEIRLIDARSAGLSDKEVTDFSLSFFPEGGYLISDLPATVAFKAQNNLGNNIEVRGEVINTHGQKVCDLVSLHDGMGLIRFKPERHQVYLARVQYGAMEKEVPLPEALPYGYQLKANSHPEDRILLSLASNTAHGLKGATLFGHIRGQVFFEETFPLSSQKEIAFRPAELPSGILHFTLFDDQQRPVSERLVFNKNPQEQITVNIAADESEFGLRSAVHLEVLPMLADSIKPARFSLSVYDVARINPQQNALNIQNYLWLQSDLRGRINRIDQYFTEDSPKTRSLLDLLMMTHGWRRFSWAKVLAGRSPTLDFPVEEHLSIAGKITGYNSDKPVKADLMLNLLAEDQFAALNLTTGEDGLFVFKGFDFPDTTDIFLQASKHRSRSQKQRRAGKFSRTGSTYLDIEVFELEKMAVNTKIGIPDLTTPTEREKEYAYLQEQYQYATDSTGASLWTIDLAEVTVRSGLNRAELREIEFARQYEEKGMFFFHSTQKFLADDPQYDAFQVNNIFELIQLVVPPAKLVKSDGRQRILLGRLSQNVVPKIALDGRVVPLAALEAINPDDISIIEILEGFYAEGMYGSSPIISLISKNPERITRPNPGVMVISHPGYYQAREFYSPTYDTVRDMEGMDLRTTLFWAPILRTENQPNRVQFYTGDLPGEYVVWVEGITANGIPFTGSRRILVR